ncbi:hypothetical protein [Arthrobacter sp. ERGS1:01]|uniref:hypothetical protein n=1 Tax=Arthrobacter sp. ERGS1:01 TaxID=1704044 RepID=UPI0006B4AAD2|nr:hypothetical protein [Arthrobacter sp. ERGS1:01]
MDEEESFEYTVGGGAEDEFAAMLFGSTEGRRSGRLPVTYRWRDMDPRTAEAVWKHLGHWVQWLVDTYHLPTSVIPDCWWKHSDIVAELYGLQRAEQASYTEDDGGFGPITFHERLTSSIDRMREHTRTAGCVGLQAHRDPARRTLPSDGPGRPNWAPDSDG